MPSYATTLPFFRDRALTDPPLPQGRWTSAYGSIDGLNRYLIEVERLLRQGDPSGELTKLYTARWAKTRGDSILTHAVFEEYRSLLAYRVSSAIQGVLEVSGDAETGFFSGTPITPAIRQQRRVTAIRQKVWRSSNHAGLARRQSFA